MSKVALEVAEKEVESWMDKKKITQSMRESLKDQIKILVESVCDGLLILNVETNEWTHFLNFPLGEEGTIPQLKYLPRLNDRLLEPHLRGVKSDDGDKRLQAYISALTGEVKGVIANLDTVDKRVSTAIASFFF